MTVGRHEALAGAVRSHELDRPEETRAGDLGDARMGRLELAQAQAHVLAERGRALCDALLEQPLEVRADGGGDHGVAGEGAHRLPADTRP